MAFLDDDRAYVDQLVVEYYGDRLTALSPERLAALHVLFGEVMWHEGIEALTPQRLNTLLDFTEEELSHAA
ncbi:hypothetical protein ABAZ39_11235 [Azospirillum argentinense]|uniref:Uncharacterized protein n=1 Tax=Azospirillum argentinense TaxID=2970906 RepID=A0A2K1FZL0_9PROT|nr:hypothetical protein [Azospirillum argentinense]AIB12556.1 hypothetical protein ABAZ39_11235 [Azospirillum argentinense]EZQ09849.1 hypothetical protein ABAZ39_12665 [Azospirillum argentinense]KAA1056499.1 hypothetical protein FH063_004647 [Azospirillum argentinense]PNQ97983.1 hypothetical protein C1S70_15420 [Azospirillum argentinense]